MCPAPKAAFAIRPTSQKTKQSKQVMAKKDDAAQGSKKATQAVPVRSGGCWSSVSSHPGSFRAEFWGSTSAKHA